MSRANEAYEPRLVDGAQPKPVIAAAGAEALEQWRLSFEQQLPPPAGAVYSPPTGCYHAPGGAVGLSTYNAQWQAWQLAMRALPRSPGSADSVTQLCSLKARAITKEHNRVVQENRRLLAELDTLRELEQQARENTLNQALAMADLALQPLPLGFIRPTDHSLLQQGEAVTISPPGNSVNGDIAMYAGAPAIEPGIAQEIAQTYFQWVMHTTSRQPGARHCPATWLETEGRALLDRLNAQRQACPDKKRLDFICSEYLVIEPIAITVGHDDVDIGWHLKQYREGESEPRLVHKSFRDNLRGALDDLIDAQANDR